MLIFFISVFLEIDVDCVFYLCIGLIKMGAGIMMGVVNDLTGVDVITFAL